MTPIKCTVIVAAFLFALVAARAGTPATAATILLRPAQVFDGIDPRPHPGWQVLVDKERIAAGGPNLPVPAGTGGIAAV